MLINLKRSCVTMLVYGRHFYRVCHTHVLSPHACYTLKRQPCNILRIPFLRQDIKFRAIRIRRKAIRQVKNNIIISDAILHRLILLSINTFRLSPVDLFCREQSTFREKIQLSNKN